MVGVQNDKWRQRELGLLGWAATSPPERAEVKGEGEGEDKMLAAPWLLMRVPFTYCSGNTLTGHMIGRSTYP